MHDRACGVVTTESRSILHPRALLQCPQEPRMLHLRYRAIGLQVVILGFGPQVSNGPGPAATYHASVDFPNQCVFILRYGGKYRITSKSIGNR
jgi:hypothetical protein